MTNYGRKQIQFESIQIQLNPKKNFNPCQSEIGMIRIGNPV